MALKGVIRMSTEKDYTSSEDSQECAVDDNSHDDDVLEEEKFEDKDDLQNTGGGWADAIAKVLSTTKPKRKKSVVLSRAKKYTANNQKEKNDYGFEIDGASEEKPDIENLQQHIKKEENSKLNLRVKPSWRDVDRERALRKIATKGVVQFFNAVRMQQKDLQHKLQEVGPIDSRKEAVLNNINKRKFLDVLMSGNRAKSEVIDNPIKKTDESSSEDENNENVGWSVLKNDFMTNKKNKHWDQSDDSESDIPSNSENDIDD